MCMHTYPINCTDGRFPTAAQSTFLTLILLCKVPKCTFCSVCIRNAPKKVYGSLLISSVGFSTTTWPSVCSTAACLVGSAIRRRTIRHEHVEDNGASQDFALRHGSEGRGWNGRRRRRRRPVRARDRHAQVAQQSHSEERHESNYMSHSTSKLLVHLPARARRCVGTRTVTSYTTSVLTVTSCTTSVL